MSTISNIPLWLSVVEVGIEVMYLLQEYPTRVNFAE